MKVICNEEITYCDAIETYKVIGGVLTPIERPEADGFKAFTIVHVSPSEEYYTEILYRFPGHTLEGFECEIATFEEDDEEEEELI